MGEQQRQSSPCGSGSVTGDCPGYSHLLRNVTEAESPGGEVGRRASGYIHTASCCTPLCINSGRHAFSSRPLLSGCLGQVCCCVCCVLPGPPPRVARTGHVSLVQVLSSHVTGLWATSKSHFISLSPQNSVRELPMKRVSLSYSPSFRMSLVWRDSPYPGP